ncbi:MAG: hypothetical protein GF421_12325 [Candidatus Aminicenantes bacterium]|nr:hypothetical protein [Candidatus Aminicenantes bacterium]
MKCYLTRWYVSRSLDSAKSIPSVLKPHLRKCPSCQHLRNSFQDIHKRAGQDAEAVLHQTSPLLTKKVKEKAFYESLPEPKIKQRMSLVPVASAAVVLVCIVMFMVFNPFKQSISKAERPHPPVLNTFFGTGETLQDLTSQIGSHYETEWDSLKKAAQTASQYFIQKMDLNIDSSKKKP